MPHLIGSLIDAQTTVKNLKIDLIHVAYNQHASPFMRRGVLAALARAGLFDGDIDAEVAKHPNYTTAYFDPNEEE